MRVTDAVAGSQNRLHNKITKRNQKIFSALLDGAIHVLGKPARSALPREGQVSRLTTYVLGSISGAQAPSICVIKNMCGDCAIALGQGWRRLQGLAMCRTQKFLRTPTATKVTCSEPYKEFFIPHCVHDSFAEKMLPIKVQSTLHC